MNARSLTSSSRPAVKTVVLLVSVNNPPVNALGLPCAPV
jgi:hypothetical protein